MWTPQGYYTGSPGADKIVGWQINKGPDKTADYVGAEQLRQHLNRPDIVETRHHPGLGRAGRARGAGHHLQARRPAGATGAALPHRLRRPPDRSQRGGRAIVKIAIEATPDPIKAIRVQVNGRQVEEQTPDIGSGGFSAGEQLLDVPLGQGPQRGAHHA